MPALTRKASASAEVPVPGSYVDEGLQGLATKGGTPRVEAARRLFGSLGGTLEGFYFAFGSDNLIVLCDIKSPAYRAPGEAG
jgi:uncharacterized protein with GYD domain